MMLKKLFYLLVAVLLLTGLSNCKKEESKVQQPIDDNPACDVLQSRPTDQTSEIGSLHYVYDNHNRIISIKENDLLKTQYYYDSPDLIFFITYNVYTDRYPDTIRGVSHFDKQGRLLDTRETLNYKDTTQYYYTYNVNNEMIGSSAYITGKNRILAKDSSTYYWENGNMVKEEKPLANLKTYHYEYYPNTSGWYIGNVPNQISLQIYNQEVHPLLSKNALKRVISGTDTIEYNITFDASGRVSSYQAKSLGAYYHTYKFKYKCL